VTQRSATADEFAGSRSAFPPPSARRPLGGLARGPSAGVLALSLVVLWMIVSTASALDASAGTGVAIGAWFLVWLVMIGPGGGFAALAAARVRRRRAAHPDEPWLWDHAWDAGGASVGPLRHLARTHSAGLIVPVVALPTILAFAARARAGPAWIAPVCVLAPLTAWSWRFWRVSRFGAARLSFTRFPYVPGEPVTLHFGMSPDGASFERAEFRLMRVKESRRGLARSAWPELMFVERRPPGLLPGPDADVEVSFDVPADAPGTRLSDSPPAYWLLEVVADTSAGPYAETFLVPIYERARA
jgi:hypothetical protein